MSIRVSSGATTEIANAMNNVVGTDRKKVAQLGGMTPEMALIFLAKQKYNSNGKESEYMSYIIEKAIKFNDDKVDRGSIEKGLASTDSREFRQVISTLEVFLVSQLEMKYSDFKMTNRDHALKVGAFWSERGEQTFLNERNKDLGRPIEHNVTGSSIPTGPTYSTVSGRMNDQDNIGGSDQRYVDRVQSEQSSQVDLELLKSGLSQDQKPVRDLKSILPSDTTLNKMNQFVSQGKMPQTPSHLSLQGLNDIKKTSIQGLKDHVPGSLSVSEEQSSPTVSEEAGSTETVRENQGTDNKREVTFEKKTSEILNKAKEMTDVIGEATKLTMKNKPGASKLIEGTGFLLGVLGSGYKLMEMQSRTDLRPHEMEGAFVGEVVRNVTVALDMRTDKTPLQFAVHAFVKVLDAVTTGDIVGKERAEKNKESIALAFTPQTRMNEDEFHISNSSGISN